MAAVREREFWFLSLLSAVMLITIYLLFSHTPLGASIDDAALSGRTVTPGRILNSQLTLLDIISVGSLALAALALVGLAVVRRRTTLALSVAVLIIGSNVVTQIMKHALAPSTVRSIAGVPLVNSFPSGHATVAMAVAVALILVVPSRLRWLAGLIGTAYAAATGVAVLVVGWHRPSDAVGAWLVVGVWAGIVLALLGHARRVPVTRPIRRTAVGTIGFLTAFVVMALAVMIAGYLAVDTWFHTTEYAELRRVAAFVTGSAAIAGSAAAFVAILLTVLRGTDIGSPPSRPSSSPAPRRG